MPCQLLVASATPTGPKVDWGSVPAWVSALGSSLAFLLAAWIYSVAERDRRRKEARLVTPILVDGPTLVKAGTSTSFSHLRNAVRPASVVPSGGTQYEVREDMFAWRLRIVNRSDEGIMDVTGAVVSPGGGEIVRMRPLQALAPRDEAEFTLISASEDAYSRGHDFRITFSDAAGRRWMRGRRTTLRRATR
jgi:hypothetical protein